jgi:hypothetical protein
VRAVVVVVDVAGELAPGLLERVELRAPHEALLQLAEPALDERLGLGVAVAAAPMRDAEARERLLERAGGERGAVVAAERQAARRDAARRDGALDERDRLAGAAAGLQMPADDLARAAVDRRHQIDPSELGHPDRRHVEMPELIGALDAEEPRPPAPLEPPATLDQPLLAHDAQHALAVHRPPQPPPRPRRDHSIAVGRMRERFLDDHALDRPAGRSALRRAPRRRPAVDRLAGDVCRARHDRRPMASGDELAGPGDALSHSQPRKSSPATSSS